MQARGVHLQYSFEATGQRGATLHNPLIDLLTAVQAQGAVAPAARSLGIGERQLRASVARWEASLGEALLDQAPGRPARLSPFAERLVWADRRGRARLTPHIEALRAELERVLAESLDGSQHVLTMHASHDLALPMLRDLASQSHGLHIDLRFAGTVDALAALAQGRCLVAGFHVPVQASGTPRLAAAITPLIKASQHVLIGCVRRTQGLMVQPGNPLGLRGLADLPSRPGHAPRFLNRQPGSGTRLLMDQLLADQGLAPEAIVGWSGPPEDSHMTVAAALAAGAADAGPGIEAAARAFGLGFVPLVDEDYHLVCQKQALDHPAVQKLRAALRDPAWPQALRSLAGYTPADGGEVRPLARALPWWVARRSSGTVAA